MKNIFFALLVANTLMGGWWLWYAATARPPASPEIELPPMGVERILLLEELPPDVAEGDQATGDSDTGTSAPESVSVGATANPQSGEDVDGSDLVDDSLSTQLPTDASGKDSATGDAPPKPEWACYRFSPSSDSGQMAQLRDELEALAADSIRSREETVSRQSGIWVMIPPARTRAGAQKTVSRLESRGFTDYYVVPEGQWKNAVSLGLFNDPENAARRLARLKRKGFSAHREVRYEEVPASYIEAALPAGTVPPTALNPQAMDCTDLLAAPASEGIE